MINIEERFTELLDKTKTDDDSAALCNFLENEITKTFKNYNNYIKLFFERALEINPDDENLWQIYLDFHREKIKDKEYTLTLLKRATKFCFFNYVFWVLLIRQMEFTSMPFEKIQEVIGKAYASAEDENFLSEIWKATLEYSVRNFDFTIEQLTSIRQTFSSAISDIQAKGNNDYILRILLILAEFEVYKAKDENQMNDLMNRIVKISPTAENWRIYISYSKYFGNVENIRKIYKRALGFCKEDKNLLAEAWVMWEKM